MMEKHERRSIEMLEYVFSPDDEIFLSALLSLAFRLRKQGKFVEAEGYYQRALTGNEATSEKNSFFSFHIMLLFSELLRDMDDPEGAERYLRQSIPGIERIKGRNHELTLSGVHILGELMQSRASFEEAEKLFSRAWNGRKQVLGPHESETLSSLQGLAICLQRRGQYCHSERLFREALIGYEAAFGRSDPKTLECVFNTSRVIYQQERYKDARELFERAVAERDRLLKTDTEESLVKLIGEGICLRLKGKLRASEKYNPQGRRRPRKNEGKGPWVNTCKFEQPGNNSSTSRQMEKSYRASGRGCRRDREDLWPLLS
ncbi:hypothetical protein N7450_005408 [Penicillium hetheringtonii]|uniref:MalT-like TPR region domain-containing protein n=1 Tax=Penicillium hetheringtonii TaxID=911720 RepID=A0AAD6GUA9_9EURO|nr:hypothetical protein N7450_005408 [Penicillium hetheringtonii]